MGVGHDQYASGPVEVQTLGHAHKVIVGEEYQQFEDETADDNLDGLEEELLDCINWAAMAILKIRSARAKADRITP